MAGVALSFRKTLTLAAIVSAVCAVALASAATPGELHLRFKSAFEAGDWATAEQRAQALINQLETSTNLDRRELVNPLTNLATVQFRQGKLQEAGETYGRAIALIDGQLSGADRLLIRPLHGLGEVQLLTGDAFEAAVPLKRAVDLSRNLDGLFNPDQLDVVDALIEAYVATGRLEDAEREHRYAFRVAETAFGKNDLQLLEPLDRFARWYESVGRYSTARGLHARALQLAERQSADKPVVGVAALRGLSRTWLLEAIYGPEVETETPVQEVNDRTGPFLSAAGAGRLNADGERALRQALKLISESKPRDEKLFGETLVQLGDWYLIAGSAQRANSMYLEAFSVLSAAGPEARKQLEQPRLLVYRAPPASLTRQRSADPSTHVVKDIDFELTIGRDGKVTEAAVASSDVPEATERSALLAVRKARYAPRVGNGEILPTEGVRFKERLLVRLPAPAN